MAEADPKKFAGSVLDLAKQTGIDIVQEGDVTIWQGECGGQTKPRGPLAGKKIACIVGSEFSDFQAYYLASYIGEFGGQLEFLCVDWVVYKFTRPSRRREIPTRRQTHQYKRPYNTPENH